MMLATFFFFFFPFLILYSNLIMSNSVYVVQSDSNMIFVY